VWSVIWVILAERQDHLRLVAFALPAKRPPHHLSTWGGRVQGVSVCMVRRSEHLLSVKVIEDREFK
jgi:hypothetical protein